MKQHFSRDDLFVIGIGIALVLMNIIGMQRSPDLIWGALLFGACVVILLLRPFLQQWLPTREKRVEYDADSIRTYVGSAIVGSILWREVDEIAIATSDTGPYENDVVWVLMNSTGSKALLIMPSEPGFPALLAELQQLPGFDHAMVVEAMGSVETQRFVVWRRTT